MARHLTVRISDDLHAAALRAAHGGSLAGFVREAIAEKVARASLAAEIAQTEQRLARLEREVERLKHRPPLG